MNRRTSYNVRYMALHGFYQITMILVASYASVYLLSKGYSDGGAGVLMAAGNAAAALLQPAMGSFLDKHPRISLPAFAAGMLSLASVFSLLMLLFKGVSLPHSALFIIVLTLMMSFQALVNSLCFLLESRGVVLNFGLARGTGSASFALTSVILGVVMTRVQPSVLPALYVAGFVCLGISYLSLKIPAAPSAEEKKNRDNAAAVQGKETQPLSLGKFVITYKKYMLFLIGSCLVMMFLLATGQSFTYQIVESIGGGTKELGYTLAICAIVELPAMAFCKKAVQRFSARWVLRISAAFFMVKFIALIAAAAWFQSMVLYYASQVFQFCSFGFFFPCAATYTAEVLPQADMVKGQSLFTSMTCVAGFLASLLGGFLLELTSVPMTLYLLFILALIGFILIWFNVGSAE